MRFGSLSGDGKGTVEYTSSAPSQAARLEVSSDILAFGRTCHLYPSHLDSQLIDDRPPAGYHIGPADYTITRTVTLTNVHGPSTTPIVYKVLANNLVDFTVNQNRGLLARGQSVEISCMWIY